MFPSSAAEPYVHVQCHFLQAQAFSPHFIETLRKTSTPYSCNEKALHLQTPSLRSSSQSCTYRSVNYNFLKGCLTFGLFPDNFQIIFLHRKTCT